MADSSHSHSVELSNTEDEGRPSVDTSEESCERWTWNRRRSCRCFTGTFFTTSSLGLLLVGFTTSSFQLSQSLEVVDGLLHVRADGEGILAAALCGGLVGGILIFAFIHALYIERGAALVTCEPKWKKETPNTCHGWYCSTKVVATAIIMLSIGVLLSFSGFLWVLSAEIRSPCSDATDYEGCVNNNWDCGICEWREDGLNCIVKRVDDCCKTIQNQYAIYFLIGPIVFAASCIVTLLLSGIFLTEAPKKDISEVPDVLHKIDAILY